MQILPIQDNLDASQLDRSQTTAAASQASAMFANMMAQQYGTQLSLNLSQQSSVNSAVSRAEDVSSTARANGSGTTSAGTEPMVTKEDFAAIRKELESAGYDPGKLDELSERVDSGLSYRALAQALGSTNSTAGSKTIDSSTKTQLLSFMMKLGFSSAEAQTLVDASGNGQTKALIKAIQRKLTAMPADRQVDISTDELSALGQVLNLSDKGQSALKGYLGAAGSNSRINTSASGLRGMVTVLSSEANGGEDLIKKVSAMRDLVSEVVRQAEEKAKGASRSDRLSQTDQDKWIATKEKDKLLKPMQDEKSGQASGKGQVAKNQTTAEGKTGTSSKDAKSDAKASQDMAKELKETLESLSSGKTGTDSSLPKSSTTSTSSMPTTNILAAQMQTQSTLGALMSAGQTTVMDKASTLFSQVQNAVLQNMSDGQSRLTLQLTPEDLGTLNVMLQVDGDKLRATIKADTPEAAKTLSDQLGQLRVALEQQGLKVEELSVSQEKVGSQYPQAWSGADGQNAGQETQQRARTLRMSQLRAVAATVDGGTMETAVSAESGETLNLVA